MVFILPTVILRRKLVAVGYDFIYIYIYIYLYIYIYIYIYKGNWISKGIKCSIAIYSLKDTEMWTTSKWLQPITWFACYFTDDKVWLQVLANADNNGLNK